MKNSENNKENNKLNFFTSNEIEVGITMKGFSTMTFFMREVLSSEAKELRKDFLALTKEKREAQTHIHQSKLLTLLCTKAPANPLPGFPEFGDDFKETLYNFFTTFSTEVEEEKKKELVDRVMTLYFREVQPEEFFRAV